MRLETIALRRTKRKRATPIAHTSDCFPNEQASGMFSTLLLPALADFGPFWGDSEATSSFGWEEGDPLQSDITTPLSPISTKPTNRHPSDVNKIFQCTIDGCDKAFNRPAKLEQHVRSHTNTRPYVCPHALCTKAFLRDAHLKHHIKSAHTDVRDHLCNWDRCGKRFLTATRLRRHQASHEGREKFKCHAEGCRHTFRKHSTLQAHVAKAHENVKPFVCALWDDDGKRCNAGFDTAYKLRDHEGRLHNTKRYACSSCSAFEPADGDETSAAQISVAFSTYSALQAHNASEHPPTCTDCGLRCSSKATLKSHIEIFHSNLDAAKRKRHVCPEPGCRAGFTKKGNLNVHIRTIHEGKGFVCEIATAKGVKGLEPWDGQGACGAPFSSKARMVEHVRKFHLGLESQPSVRSKRAKRKGASAIDRLTGSEQPNNSNMELTCPDSECQWTFLRSHDLEQHLRATHGLSGLEIRALNADTAGSIEELYMRPSLTGYSTYATADDIAAEGAFNAMAESPSRAADNGDAFWLGGCNTFEQAPEHDGNDWFDEEMGMRRLIDGDGFP